MSKNINYESDFKLIEGFKDGSSITNAPFRFTYYTKVSRGVYIAEYNGSEFVNCHPSDDGRVIVPFDSPQLGMGVLMVKREFFLNDSDFKDGICNLVSVENTGVTLDKGATDMDGEVNIELFPFYQQGEAGKSAYDEWLELGNTGTVEDFLDSLRGKPFTYEDFTPEQLESLKGPKGDTFTYDDLTQEQKEDLAYQVIGEAENERRAAELVRQENEAKREAQEGVRTETFTANERSREQAFNVAQSNRNTEFQQAETNRSNTFSANEVSRQQSFDANEDARQSIFSANEAERQASEAAREAAEGARESAESLRKQAEEARENTFAANEKSRQDTFADNESARQSAFVSNEAIRQANETSRQEAEVIREENEKRREETYQNKVDRDDNAPKLTAGFANNLVGRGEATPEVISFRSSGGDTSIEDGTARIERIKGDTVVWNQFAPTDLSTYILLRGTNETYVDGVFTATANTANSSSYIYKYASEIVQSRLGRIIYGVAEIKAESTNAEIYIIGVGTKYVSATGDWQKIETFGKVSVWSGAVIGAGVRVKDELVTWSIRKLKYYDLTQMFGEGNEPTTIEDFHKRKPINVDKYAYNEGELISTNVEGIKSVGFNAWDGTTEFSSKQLGLNYANKLSKSDSHSLKNVYRLLMEGHDMYYSCIVSGTVQSAPIGTLSAVYNGMNKGLLRPGIIKASNFSEENLREALEGLEAGDAYVYGTDKSDWSISKICIHLVHTGYRNGEYEPYKDFTRSLPIKDIKDKDGNQLFPYGLLSAGGVYDEITATKAIKRIGVVDLGTLTYTLNAINGYYYSDGFMQANYADLLNNIACSHYITKHWGGAGGFTLNYAGGRNTCVAIWKSNTTGLSRVNILDDSVADVAELMAMLREKDVMLYYELAEPIEVDLPEPLNFDYEVSDFGTEEIVSSEPTTPMKADIVYQFNAVDRIRDNSRHTAEAETLLAAKADKTYVDEMIRQSIINEIHADL